MLWIEGYTGPPLVEDHIPVVPKSRLTAAEQQVEHLRGNALSIEATLAERDRERKRAKAAEADKDRLQRERDEMHEGRERARHYESKRLEEAVVAEADRDRLQRENEKLEEMLRKARKLYMGQAAENESKSSPEPRKGGGFTEL